MSPWSGEERRSDPSDPCPYRDDILKQGNDLAHNTELTRNNSTLIKELHDTLVKDGLVSSVITLAANSKHNTDSIRWMRRVIITICISGGLVTAIGGVVAAIIK